MWISTFDVHFEAIKYDLHGHDSSLKDEAYSATTRDICRSLCIRMRQDNSAYSIHEAF